MISPVPTHPRNAGNRARIYNLAQVLKRKGCDVHFLYVDREAGDQDAMRSFWNDKLHCFHYTQPCVALLSRAQTFFLRFFYSPDECRYNVFVDDWYDRNLDHAIAKLQNRECFDTVITEYVFLSRALLNFPENVLKILDTHDIFTNRFQLYLKNSQVPQWFSTYAKEEAKALGRADVIIAIQHHEKEYFTARTHKKVIRFGYTVDFCPVAADFKKRLLFVGSHNPINISGINHFIQNVFDSLKQRYPDMTLILAGNICSAVSVRDGIILRGEFDDPVEIYREADIVINPIAFGTGLNIKTLEALSYGKPLVTTETGMTGIEQGRNSAFLVADDDAEFAGAVSRLIDNEAQRTMLIKNAALFIETYNCSNLQELAQELHLS